MLNILEQVALKSYLMYMSNRKVSETKAVANAQNNVLQKEPKLNSVNREIVEKVVKNGRQTVEKTKPSITQVKEQPNTESKTAVSTAASFERSPGIRKEAP